MKKMMRKLIAALLAVCCIPVTAVAANADYSSWYYGIDSWEKFEEMEPINSYVAFGKDAAVYADDLKEQVTCVTPRKNKLRFIFRDDLEMRAASEEALDIMETYFPDIRKGLDPYYKEYIGVCAGYRCDSEYGSIWYQQDGMRCEITLSDLKNDEDPPDSAYEFESELLFDLAQHHLISEFYGWGGTAEYGIGDFYGEPLSGYPANLYEEDDTAANIGDRLVKKAVCDVTEVQAYLDENHSGCVVETYESEPMEIYYQEEDVLLEFKQELFKVVVPPEMSFSEKLELACELKMKFDLPLMVFFPAEPSQLTHAHNALERAGDVTLDCELDIMDVIAANKYILGVDTLCDTAKKNADVSGDGTPDASDALAIMKEVVGVTTDFAES